MVIVTMRQTMQAAILMVVTVVEQMPTPNGVMNVFVINKLCKIIVNRIVLYYSKELVHIKLSNIQVY